MRYILGSILILLVVSSYAQCADDTISVDSLVGEVCFDIGYSYNDRTEVGYGNISIATLSKNEKWEFVFPFLPVSAVRRDSDVFRYGFVLPYQFSVMVLGYFGNLIFNHNRDIDMFHGFNAIHVALFVPNHKINLLLNEHHKFYYAMNTNFLPLRLSGLDRGIVFTPSIGYSYKGNYNWGSALGFSIGVSYTYFWNFEGASNADGFGVMLMINGFGVGH